MNKTYKLQWTTNAKGDFLSILSYIKKDSSSIANDIYLKIRTKAKDILSYKGIVIE